MAGVAARPHAGYDGGIVLYCREFPAQRSGSIQRTGVRRQMHFGNDR